MSARIRSDRFTPLLRPSLSRVILRRNEGRLSDILASVEVERACNSANLCPSQRGVPVGRESVEGGAVLRLSYKGFRYVI